MVWAWLLGAMAWASPGGEAELLAEEMALGAVALGVPSIAVADDLGDGGVILVGGGAGLLVGAVAGIGVSRWKRPTEGQAMAFTTAQLVGLSNGTAWSYALERDREAGWIGLGGLAVGSVAGLAWMDGDPRPGDVALVRSGLLWGSLAGLSARVIDPRDRFWNVATMAIGADVGLLGGALLAAQPGGPSREQVARVQTAGLGGGLAGLAVGLGLQGYGAGNDRTVVGATALGVGAGVGLGIANLRPLQDAGTLAMQPLPGGAGVTWAGRW
jgi:hypothetical protein